MLKRNALALLLAGAALGQFYPVEQHLDDVTRVKCGSRLQKDFSCAVFFDVDPPLHEGIDIASVVGVYQNILQPYAMIRSISVILNDTLYTAVYNPPLQRYGTLSHLSRNVGIPVRIEGDNLIAKWPDGTVAKAKIVRREKFHPSQPQPG